jgi:hypothetical protein
MMMSHESKTTQKAQRPNKHHHHGDGAAHPLQRHGFDEPMPPGGGGLRMFVTMPPLKQFNRISKFK